MHSRCVGCHGRSKHIWWTTNDSMASLSTLGIRHRRFVKKEKYCEYEGESDMGHYIGLRAEKGTWHPEDLSSLTGCRRGRSTGLDCSRPVPPLCGLRGASAVSANFHLAQTCELLGANWNMNCRKERVKEREEGSGMCSGASKWWWQPQTCFYNIPIN